MAIIHNLKLTSKVIKCKPTELVTTSAGGKGLIRLTPNKTYILFSCDYTLLNAPNSKALVLVKDENRWFFVGETWAKNHLINIGDKEFMYSFLSKFNADNEHIRKGKEEQIKIDETQINFNN